MGGSVVANALSMTLFTAALFIALRAFFLCFHTIPDANYRLIILSFSMGLLALTAIASYADSNMAHLPVDVNWFKYIGQTLCFVFIALSLLKTSERYQRNLLYWQVIVSLLLFVLLLPVVSNSIPSPTILKALLGGTRSIICFVIFFFYVSAFMYKETRFSLGMSFAFLLLATGYMLNFPKYLASGFTLLDTVGDGIRVSGVLLLLLTMLVG